jgi:O-antigen/teichoic acid export membrane protein
MNPFSNYYFTSFFWTTISKLLNTILSFISIPILMAQYGKEQYGILSIAVACNACVYVFDMGMNVGAVKFISGWRAEENWERIERVVRTNITFYLLVSLVNIILFLGVSLFGANYFSISSQQAELLSTFMLILALFSVMSWVGNVFYQLLVAHEQLGYAMKVQTVQTLLKIALLLSIMFFDISIKEYFFVFTLLLSIGLLPYAYRCRRSGLIRKFAPALYVADFKVVLAFSASIFVLSLLQIISVQGRPLLLGIFAENGASMVADYRIVELIPNFLVVLCGMYASIFLPKISAMMVKGDMCSIQEYANIWTLRISIFSYMVGGAIFFSASELMFAYLGDAEGQFDYWLKWWLPAIVLQIHATPTTSIILAKGISKPLVVVTLLACVVSLPINVVCLDTLGVGAAVASYYAYIFIIMAFNYVYYYDNAIGVSGKQILQRFMLPTVAAVVSLLLCNLLFELLNPWLECHTRTESILHFIFKSSVWVAAYFLVLKSFKIKNAFKELNFK